MANRDLQEETDAFVNFLNEWGAKHLGPEYQQKQQVSRCAVEVPLQGDEAAGRGPEQNGVATVSEGSQFQRIHLVNREISLGTHPQGCQCSDCRIREMYEE